jgi:hypothetical protein
VGWLGYSESARAPSLAIFPAILLQVNLINPLVSPTNEEANVNISLTAVALSAELLEENVVPMGPFENVGQPDEVPVVVGHADDEDEEDEEDEEDVDDLDEDEDQEDEDYEALDDEDLDEDFDDDWEEVTDEDEDEDDDDEEEDEDEEDE